MVIYTFAWNRYTMWNSHVIQDDRYREIKFENALKESNTLHAQNKYLIPFKL